MMKIASMLFAVAMMLAAFSKVLADEWTSVFEDDFNRAAIGSGWHLDFGDGRNVHLLNNCIRMGHSSTLRCSVPLPSGDMRVEMDIKLAAITHTPSCNGHKDGLAITLRASEVGLGGIDERVMADFRGMANAAAFPKSLSETIQLNPETIHHVVLQIKDGVGSVTVDQQEVASQKVAPAGSEVKRYLVINSNFYHFNAKDDALIDNVKIFSRAGADLKMVLKQNTEEENRKATVDASKFIDPSNPALGIQKAIDSLPSSGGTVILSAGEFLMRRHLRLPGNVALCGQGAGKTILRADHEGKVPIVTMKTSEKETEITVDAANAGKFRVGDAVAFEDCWSHPGELDFWMRPVEVESNRDCIVTAMNGNTLTIRGLPPPGPAAAKNLTRYFPLIYALNTEFIELRDLTLVGTKGKGWGGFMASAVTMGSAAGVRIERVQINGWDGDGISIQTGGDMIVTDNTVSGAYQGYHPGTTTQRMIWLRNLGLGNTACGFYYCYNNRNGVVCQNTLDRFDGYAWPNDIFHVIAGNDSTGPFGLEQGWWGVIFNNRFSQIKIGHGQPSSPTFAFILAQNFASELIMKPGAINDIILAGNHKADGKQVLDISACPADKNLLSPEGAGLDMSRFPIGISRRDPEPCPNFPQPVLDGREFYKPKQADCGFQAALDKLGKTGGTLILPAGRYPLGKSLLIPRGVTLAGRGLGTVLHAADGKWTGSLIIAGDSAKITIRDLVIRGEYGRKSFRQPAVSLKNLSESQVIGVDVRGWEGTGISVENGKIKITECRVMGCAGDGFVLRKLALECRGNIARECESGFVIEESAKGSSLEANISGSNRKSGYILKQVSELWFAANNSNWNDADGVLLLDANKAELIGNSIANNNQSLKGAAGIKLDGTTRDCLLYYNGCFDGQPVPAQTSGITEAKSAINDIIRFNLVTRGSVLTAEGQGSKVSDNIIMK